MPDVKMNYPSVDEMIQSFTKAAGQLQDTSAAMKNVVSMLQGGALVNNTGDKMVEALNSTWIPMINDAMDHCQKLASELQQAMQDLVDQDTSAQGRFQV